MRTGREGGFGLAWRVWQGVRAMMCVRAFPRAGVCWVPKCLGERVRGMRAERRRLEVQERQAAGRALLAERVAQFLRARAAPDR